MSTINAGNIKKGMYIEFRGEPHEVTKSEFYAPGKGSALARIKMRNVRTGNTIDFNYKSGESIEELDIMAKEMQFLYLDGEDVVFMDPRTYEQVSVSKTLLEGKTQYLIPELTMYLLFYDEKVIGVRFPMKVSLKVKTSEDAVGGNTVNAPKKQVTLETGAVMMVPLFIKEGDTIVIDTESGTYLNRG